MTTKWGDLKQALINDLDLQEESMISSVDLDNWANDAIDDAEEMVHAETEGFYFETEAPLVDIVDGQSDYALPDDLYAEKIVKVFCITECPYEIEEAEDIGEVLGVKEGPFRYRFVNSPSGKKIRLYPTPKATITGGLFLSYIRNAAKIETDESILDIPEAHGFIKQYIKDECSKKEKLDPTAAESPALKRKRESLKTVLQKRTQTENKRVPVNVGYYNSHT